jgi:hypothetical protein
MITMIGPHGGAAGAVVVVLGGVVVLGDVLELGGVLVPGVAT